MRKGFLELMLFGLITFSGIKCSSPVEPLEVGNLIRGKWQAVEEVWNNYQSVFHKKAHDYAYEFGSDNEFRQYYEGKLTQAGTYKIKDSLWKNEDFSGRMVIYTNTKSVTNSYYTENRTHYVHPINMGGNSTSIDTLILGGQRNGYIFYIKFVPEKF
jgi:hypothetical protein